MLKIILIVAGVIAALFVSLFGIYFFNLDMKLMINVIAPLFEKHYDRRKREQYL